MVSLLVFYSTVSGILFVCFLERERERTPVCLPPDEGESFNPLKIDVFLQTLLHLAAKSFSHSFSALGK